MTADRRLVGLGYAALAGAAGGEYVYWGWTPSWWLPGLVTVAGDVMVFLAGLSMAIRSCR